MSSVGYTYEVNMVNEVWMSVPKDDQESLVPMLRVPLPIQGFFEYAMQEVACSFCGYNVTKSPECLP